MSGVLPMAVSALLHVLVPAALIARELHGDFPEPYVPIIICVFPDRPFDPVALLLGSTAAEVQGILDAPSTPEPGTDAPCVSYRFRSGSVITLFFQHGLVKEVGLGPGRAPHACLRTTIKVVTLPKDA